MIVLGLGSRRLAPLLPHFLRKNAGDVLWALAVFLCCGLLLPRASTLKTGLLAALFSISIEFSQLYHAPWIEALRRTTLGGLILGYGFHWGDIICYLVGIAFGVLLEWRR